MIAESVPIIPAVSRPELLISLRLGHLGQLGQ